MFVTLLAGFLISVPLPKLPEQPSLECKIHRSYIGAILDHEYTLTIDGPDKKTWQYRFEDRNVTLPAPVKTVTEGTYEIDGGVALFTVLKDKAPQARFGLNFRREDKEVFFDAFFPQKDSRMTYTRRWYEKDKDGFRLVESLTLTFAAPDPKTLGKVWDIHYQGEHVSADADGKLKKVEINHKEPYEQYQPNHYARKGTAAPPWWLTPEMLLVVREGRLVRVQRGHPTINDANGFHPSMAERPVLVK